MIIITSMHRTLIAGRTSLIKPTTSRPYKRCELIIKLKIIKATTYFYSVLPFLY